jgi:hypothetical protein
MPTKTTGGGVDQGWEIWANGYIEAPANFPNDGKYRFVIDARGQLAQGIAPDMELRIDQQPVQKVSVPASSWTSYVIDADVKAGSHKVAIAFTNDYYNPPEDRNLFVDKVAISLLSSATTAPPTSTGTSDRTLIVGPRISEILQGRLTPIVASTTLKNVVQMEIHIDGQLVLTSNSNSIRYPWAPNDIGPHIVEIYALGSTSILGYWTQTVVVK